MTFAIFLTISKNIKNIFLFFFSDVPSAPLGPLQLVSIDIDNVKIAWQPPTENGGSPITGYSVDFREWGREVWSPVTALTAKTTLRVTNLRKHVSYQFRVIAENVIGSGKSLVSAKCTTAYSYGL